MLIDGGVLATFQAKCREPHKISHASIFHVTKKLNVSRMFAQRLTFIISYEIHTPAYMISEYLCFKRKFKE